jgi:hypothetical protein
MKSKTIQPKTCLNERMCFTECVSVHCEIGAALEAANSTGSTKPTRVHRLAENAVGGLTN